MAAVCFIAWSMEFRCGACGGAGIYVLKGAASRQGTYFLSRIHMAIHYFP
jgi:hypothetical protein